MALSKTIEISNSGILTGVNATYWVIDRIEFRLILGRIQCKLNGYVSSAAFSANKGPISDRFFEAAIPPTFSTMTGTQMIVAIQDYIKTQAEFSGATDAA